MNYQTIELVGDFDVEVAGVKNKRIGYGTGDTCFM